jgi:heme/copper-type cytochrome/quinol oxidase subunit 2
MAGAGIPLLLSGCQGPLSTLDPAGPAASAIADLWWIMLAGSMLIWAFVMGLLIVALRRNRADDSVPEARHVRIWLVKLGLAFPLTVLAALLGYGLWIGERLLPRNSDAVVAISAEARRWTWRFGYPELDDKRATIDVLHIPAGRPVDVHITTSDVIHSFWVPRLAGKMDAVPGYVNVLRIEADMPGSYAGRSAEFSGDGYLGHRFEVVVHDAESWRAFLGGAGE